MSHILIVDDESSIRTTLSEFLMAAGYQVETAEDAVQAERLVQAQAYDVVLTDIILPRVSGIELLMKIRSQAPYTLVLMMTGEPTVDTAVEAVRLGAYDYLVKPVSKGVILQAVARAMKVRELMEEKQRLEAEHQEYQTQLEYMVEQRTAEVRKLARALEQSPVSIVITDRKGNIEYVNPKFTTVTGYAAAEVLGQNPRILKSGETSAEGYRQLWETIAAGKEWRGEFHNRKKDGTLFWETASIAPLRDASGAITHFIAAKEDVTERRLTETKLLRAQRVESIGSLASGIAHDLNNILAPILMCAPMLRQELPAELREQLAQTMEESALRAVGVVKQLLSFARGKEGQKQPIQLRHLVRDMVKIVRETFPRSIQIEEHCSSELWPIVADSTQIHQVLLNLCVNARDAMPAGGKLILSAQNVMLDEHFVSTYPEVSPGPHVRLEVQDTGTGISEEHQSRIFESFFTTKGEGEGTGLGLTTVQGIVKDHKSLISFGSTPGKGTTFIIHLPAVPDASHEAQSGKGNKAIPRGQGEVILLVDDERSVCVTAQRTLQRHGYSVLLAQDGIQGLTQFTAHQHEIRAVVTDSMMPLMDGVTLARALRALSPETPILVSSGGLLGKSGTNALLAFKELGIKHILHKPHTADVLLAALAEVVDQNSQLSLPGIPHERSC